MARTRARAARRRPCPRSHPPTRDRHPQRDRDRSLRLADRRRRPDHSRRRPHHALVGTLAARRRPARLASPSSLAHPGSTSPPPDRDLTRMRAVGAEAAILPSHTVPEGNLMADKHNSGPPRKSRPEPIEIAHDVAHPARVYDYVRGGDDNFTADREVADFAAAAVSGGFDHARAAVQANEAFHARSVTYLAREAGIRQFLEIAAGIPTDENTHEIAQRIAPESRVVYADDDPVVLAHAHTLRKSASKGATAYVNANLRDPDAILQQAQTVLDLGQPVAVVIAAILHHIPEEDDPYHIVARFVDAVPSGSFLVISHLTSDIIANEVTEAARRINEQPGFTLVLRTHDQICRFLDGTEPLPPGLVPVDRWHAPGSPPPPPGDWPTPFYGAVARKP